MKKKIITGLLVLLAVGSIGYANIFTFGLNYFIPRAQSGSQYPDSLWTVEFENMNFTKSSFQNASFGAAYEFFLTDNFSLVLSFDTYSKNRAGFYKDYTAISFDDGDWAFPNDYKLQGDFTPSHSLDISITPIQLSVKIAPLGRRHKFIPYIGAGVGIYISRVRMRGDMIDFSQSEIFSDDQGNQYTGYPIGYVDAWEGGNGIGKVSFGWHVLGGFMIPVANRMTIDVNFKFNNARVKFTDYFQGFDYFDLGGYQFGLGLNYWF